MVSKKEAIFEGGDQNLKDPSQLKVREACFPELEIKRVSNNLEDVVIIEEVLDEEEEIEGLRPENGNSVADFPKNEGVSGMHNQIADISNHPLLLSEQGLIRGEGSDVGVAQEISDVAEELSSGTVRYRAVASETIGGVVVSLGPEKLGESPVHFAVPKDEHVPKAQKHEGFGPTSSVPPIHISDTMILDLAHFPALKVSDLVTQKNFIPEPKALYHEGLSSPRDSCSDVDNWLLSERKRSLAERSVLNKNAEAFFPSPGYHRSPSWIEDGEDWGPEHYCNERNYASEGSILSEFQHFDEDYENDFSVHPPLRRNSTSDLPRRYSPPITRSRGLKMPKKKNKFRLG